MSYQRVNQYGQAYAFGLDDPSAPTINGFKPNRAETKFDSEVFVQSKEGEGHTDGVTVSKPEYSAGTVTVSGYVTNLAAFNLLPGTSFEFESRFWIIRSISKPRVAGELLEASLEAQSFALVTGPA
jgi:hypothetical protein